MTTEAMKAVDVRINLVAAQDSKIRAYASLKVELPTLGTWALNHIRVIEGSKGLFVSMPSQKKGEGEDAQYFDHFHPLTKEGRDQINEVVLEAFEKATVAANG